MTPDDPRIHLAAELLPIACELIGSVRDYGPETVADVLARVPDGRHDALAVVLAAMVDPDAKTSELLAWVTQPAKSRDYTPHAYAVKSVPRATRGEALRVEVARLTANGLASGEIAERLGIQRRSVTRIRARIRERSQAIHRQRSA